MAPAARVLERALAEVAVRPLAFPVVSNVTRRAEHPARECCKIAGPTSRRTGPLGAIDRAASPRRV